MDIFTHLEREHDKIIELLDELENSGTPEEKRNLLQHLKKELLSHAKAEERTLYAQISEFEEGHELIEQAKDDHSYAESLLEDLMAMDPDSDDFLDRVEELRDCVEDHIDEEETEIFEKARDLLNAAETREIAESYRKEEEQLRAAL